MHHLTCSSARRRTLTRPAARSIPWLLAAALSALVVGAPSTRASAQAPSCVNWAYDGRDYRTCYVPRDSFLSWEQARLHCMGLGEGWDLIDVNNEAENAAAAMTIDRARLRRDTIGPWIGFNDRSTEGIWANLRSQTLCYENWAIGEPNDLEGEDCAHLFGPGFTRDPFRWNDYNCDGRPAPTGGVNSFFCERGSMIVDNCGCLEDAHCAGMRPRCFVDTRQCVECLDDSDCGGATPICELAGHSCVPDNTDTDGDGVRDAEDLDDDNDGIPDTVDAHTGGPDEDEDGDGIPNRLDLDSDGDGMPDVLEAGGADEDRDGRIDGFVDTNNNGLHDPVESTPLPTPDTDADGSPDFLDLDSDGDGISDTVEAGGRDVNGDGYPDVTDFDGNRDGWVDAVSGDRSLPVSDSDMDGRPDYRSLDSDSDGVPDAIEGHDLDGDGVADRGPSGVDRDGDGLDDAFDPVCVASGCQPGVSAPTPDHDGDGRPDFQDADDDEDGIQTRDECPAGPTCPATVDPNIPDYLNPNRAVPGEDAGPPPPADAGVDAGPAPTPGGVSGGALCSARPATGGSRAAWLLVGLAGLVAARRRRRS